MLLQGIASHDYEETVVEADCYVSGGINYVCRVCNTGYFDETQAALGHSYNLESSTCTEDKYCTRCEVVFENATGHTDVWATCTTPHYCSTCEEVLSPVLAHTFNAEEADCLQSKYCVVCNYVEAEKLGHDPDREAPTCTDPVRCTRCPAVLEYETGHTYNNEGGVTCTEDYYCTTCNEVFGYASGHLPMFDSVQCEVDNTCIRCEVLLQAAAGHDYKAETLREASCQSEGVISHTCQRCYNSYEEYPPKLEHNPVKEDDVPSTCTQHGHTGATVCSLCGKVFAAQSPLPLLDHKDENGDGKCDSCGYSTECEHSWSEGTVNSAPTCTQQGTKTLTCLVCGDVKTETIEALGHTEETVEGKAATCTEAGLTEGKKCSVCAEVLVAQETIKALGHTEETVEGKAATCTEAGLTEGKKCSVCAEVLVAQETIEALGHSYSEATCTQKATCSVCNAQTGELADHVDASEDGKCDVCQYQMSTPEETTPEDTTTTEPEESTPEESTPEESTPEESTPEESTPEESTPEETTPEESTPVESTPNETTPDETTPNEEEAKEGLSGGAIAGIVAGSTVVVGGGGFSLFWFVIRKKRW